MGAMPVGTWIGEGMRRRRYRVFADFEYLLMDKPKSIDLLRHSRKEVIQPQVPLRLPCYDFTPVADLTVVVCPLAVGATP